MLLYKHTKRIVVLEIIFSLFISIIAFKLCYLQICKNNVYLAMASDMWQRSFPLLAPRGYIYDTNMITLASNIPTFSLAFMPYQIKDKYEVASRVGEILGVDRDELYNKINKNISIVRLNGAGRNINDDIARRISLLNLEGVYLLQDSKRYYPYDNMLSNVLGFSGVDNQGLAGIEAYYDNYLKGTNGSLNYYMDAKGGLFSNLESNIVSPVSGLSISLTVDFNIQSILERELNNAYVKYNPSSIMGMVMNPNTGEILAMSNYPNYNPNNYKEYDSYLYNFNLPVWKSYEPGSTFKVFSFAAALNEKKINMYKDTYYDTGSVKVGGATIKSWKKGGHGLQTYLEVLQNSSNPGFVSIARKLGKDNLFNYITNFGFGSKTGVDMYGETSGIMFKYESYNELEQATSAFGQGISVSMIQMMAAYSSLINGGNLMKPYILKDVRTTNTNDIVYENKPVLVRKVISKETSDLMRDALEHVASLGSGRTAYIDGYRVGGKTGTAQIVNPETGAYYDREYNLSMIASAPMDDPSVVAYVVMERPHSAIQYGGTIVGPIIKNILEDVLPYMGVSKRSGGIDKSYTWMDTKTYIVDNYIGKSKKEVKSQYFKFEFVGVGDKVIDQLPKMGEKIEEGSTIVIMLG
ncbi:MAG: stage V sporulation protein D [Bacilli bacterium]|nr:stage V sporulation protein D [Bacilli bacterium]